jgi:phage-related holin
MTIRQTLSTLVLTLILIGYLTNSVMQRVIGPVEGSPVWPALILCLLVIAALLAMKRIDSWLKTLNQ